MRWLAELPATNARILVTLALFVATGIVSDFGRQPIETEWLVFLGVMAGVDVAQHLSTHRSRAPASQVVSDAEEASEAR